MELQKTVAKEINFSGIGLHTGKVCNIIFKPADVDTGIRLIRTDLPNKVVLPAVYHNVPGVIRGTCIGLDERVQIYTVEHLLSALIGLGIDNLQIYIDNNEPPVFDGSALPFVNYILSAGILEQHKPKKYFTLQEKVEYQFYKTTQEVTTITAIPSDSLIVDCTIIYDHPLLQTQQLSICITAENFIKEIAPAKTFCFDYEIEAIKRKGLAKGGNLENTIIIGHDKIYNEDKMTFKDEFVRHKILDFLGDLYLLGLPLKAQITAVRCGHKHNINFVREVISKAKIYPKELSTEEIKKIIPHREPFLFIDRVIITKEAKSAIGYKTVTGKEDFFNGHFPGNPIMPGVLVVEAMAQTACVLFLSKPELSNKLPYFMTLEKVKFRKPVFPGNVLTLQIDVLHTRGLSGKVRGEAFIDKTLVAEAEFMFMLVDR